MITMWSAEKIRQEWKAGKRCLVCKTLRGDFRDLSQTILSEMEGDFKVQEEKYEVIIHLKPRTIVEAPRR